MIKLMSHFCDPEATESIIVKTVKNSIGISFGLVRAGTMTNFFLDLIGKPLFSGKLGSQKVPERQVERYRGESFAKANI